MDGRDQGIMYIYESQCIPLIYVLMSVSEYNFYDEILSKMYEKTDDPKHF